MGDPHNPNNCSTCEHKLYQDGGHCYMFRFTPTEPCAHHTFQYDLRDRLVAISEAIADQDDRAAQAMLREILKAPQPSPTAQAAATQPAPVLWLSPEQFANFVDADEAPFGKYIPARKTSAGKFTMPLFADATCALRASRGQAPAQVLHLVQDAFAEVAMAYPKAFALHKVGLADTAVRKALDATPSPQAADSVLEDAARYQWLFGARTKEQVENFSDTVMNPLPQDDVLSMLQCFFRHKAGVDAVVDAARKQGGA